MASDLFLAFWNLENLFDVEGSPDRSEKLAKVVGKDLQGWSQEVLRAKLGQLSLVIRSLNQGHGPDILGVCEVENKAVLKKLTQRIEADGGRRYKVEHDDCRDHRGIDVAFLYDGRVAVAGEKFQHWVVKRFATRDLYQVNFTVGEKKLVLVGNHWPSRSGGQYESEPYRMLAGETLSYWMERIQEEQGQEVGVVAMVDFNDEPFNRSLMEYALAVNDPRSVTQGKKPYLLNLAWPILDGGQGSYLHEGDWNALDQILVSRGVVNGKSGWRVEGPQVIEAKEIMSRPKGQGPRSFRLKKKTKKAKWDLQGFSDHYPVSVKLKG